ncbi:MAG TPA: hypothetical protein PLS67_00405 [Accumulibacter sp.]|nr:hypothetical protein [Accumulibacter sp.]HQC78963.1 hypothetical protein [Accumulibacter sp.]
MNRPSRDLTELQEALTQHPRYEEILRLVIPICRKNAPPDAAACSDLMLRTDLEKSWQIVAQWRRDLAGEGGGHLAAVAWPKP